VPFTPSHAIVALPFARTALQPAAVAVGAMAPDLPLFLGGLPLPYGMTHDLLWLPATVVIAAALLLVWRCLVRPVARGLVPEWVAVRLPETWDRGVRASAGETFAVRGSVTPSWPGALLLVAALAIGVVSHIVWDAFTHEGRWGTTLIPALGERWGSEPGYAWLQDVSGLAALAGIVAWIVWWLVRHPARPPRTAAVPAGVRLAWWVSLPVFLVAGLVVGIARFGAPDDSHAVTSLAYRALTPTCALWGAATLVLCVVLLARPRREPAE
jgi:hypothetical protein